MTSDSSPLSPTTEPRPAQVRLALPAEAAAIAALQRRCWDVDQPDEMRDWLLDQVDLAELTQVWHSSIAAPPQAHCRVLVAVSGSNEVAPSTVVGFATTEPASDPDADPGADAEIAEWLVDPAGRSLGHGSRLLNAAIDTLRADGFDRALIWIASTDDGRRSLLVESGWAPDGSHRTIGPAENVTIKQVRLHTTI